jgi:uncharacterized protein
VSRSAAFYTEVFGRQVRRRGDGSTAFDDGVGEVSGIPGHRCAALVRGRHAALGDGRRHRGRAGGRARGRRDVVQPVGVDAPELTARFRDPAGNVLGLYR